MNTICEFSSFCACACGETYKLTRRVSRLSLREMHISCISQTMFSVKVCICAACGSGPGIAERKSRRVRTVREVHTSGSNGQQV